MSHDAASGNGQYPSNSIFGSESAGQDPRWPAGQPSSLPSSLLDSGYNIAPFSGQQTPYAPPGRGIIYPPPTREEVMEHHKAYMERTFGGRDDTRGATTNVTTPSMRAHYVPIITSQTAQSQRHGDIWTEDQSTQQSIPQPTLGSLMNPDDPHIAMPVNGEASGTSATPHMACVASETDSISQSSSDGRLAHTKYFDGQSWKLSYFLPELPVILYCSHPRHFSPGGSPEVLRPGEDAVSIPGNSSYQSGTCWRQYAQFPVEIPGRPAHTNYFTKIRGSSPTSLDDLPKLASSLGLEVHKLPPVTWKGRGCSEGSGHSAFDKQDLGREPFTWVNDDGYTLCRGHMVRLSGEEDPAGLPQILQFPARNRE